MYIHYYLPEKYFGIDVYYSGIVHNIYENLTKKTSPFS